MEANRKGKGNNKKSISKNLVIHSVGFLYDKRNDITRTELDQLKKHFQYSTKNIPFQNVYHLKISPVLQQEEYINDIYMDEPDPGPQIEVFTTIGRGLGARTVEPIKEGQIVGMYAGEAIPNAVLRELGSFHKSGYMMELSKVPVKIDSKRVGNVLRMINHSCEPNLVIKEVRRANKYKVVFEALEDINPSVELTLNYGKEYNLFDFCNCGQNCCKTKFIHEVIDKRPFGFPYQLCVNTLIELGHFCTRIDNEFQKLETSDKDVVFDMMKALLSGIVGSANSVEFIHAEAETLAPDIGEIGSQGQNSGIEMESLSSVSLNRSEETDVGRLANIGNTCFGNASFQSLFYLQRSFRDYFIKKLYMPLLKKNWKSSLCYEVTRCFEKLEAGALTDIGDIINCIGNGPGNPILGQEFDAMEFVYKVLEQLESEFADIPGQMNPVRQMYQKRIKKTGRCNQCSITYDMPNEVDPQLLHFPHQESQELALCDVSDLVESRDAASSCRKCNNLVEITDENIDSPDILICCVVRPMHLAQKIGHVNLTKLITTCDGAQHYYDLKSVVYYVPDLEDATKPGHYICCCARENSSGWIKLDDEQFELVGLPFADTHPQNATLEQPMEIKGLFYEKQDLNIKAARQVSPINLGSLPSPVSPVKANSPSSIGITVAEFILDICYPLVRVSRRKLDAICVKYRDDTNKNKWASVTKDILGLFYDHRTQDWFSNCKIGKPGELGENVILHDHVAAIIGYISTNYHGKRQDIELAITNYFNEKKHIELTEGRKKRARNKSSPTTASKVVASFHETTSNKFDNTNFAIPVAGTNRTSGNGDPSSSHSTPIEYAIGSNRKKAKLDLWFGSFQEYQAKNGLGEESKSPYTCRLCSSNAEESGLQRTNYSYESFIKLKEHYEEYHKNKYRCHFCLRQFANIKQLEQHKETCKMKPGTAVTAASTESHINGCFESFDEYKKENNRLKNKSSPFMCHICSSEAKKYRGQNTRYNYINNAKLMDHYNKYHRHRYLCKKCFLRFSTTEELFRHSCKKYEV